MVINDAAMQALGSYEKGRMLFLGLGTGLGSAMVFDGVVEPMELAHLPYKKKRTYEDYVGLRGLERFGKKKWRKHVLDIIDRLQAAFEAEEAAERRAHRRQRQCVCRRLPALGSREEGCPIASRPSARARASDCYQFNYNHGNHSERRCGRHSRGRDGELVAGDAGQCAIFRFFFARTGCPDQR
jgi:hypothetical protein